MICLSSENTVFKASLLTWLPTGVQTITDWPSTGLFWILDFLTDHTQRLAVGPHARLLVSALAAHRAAIGIIRMNVNMETNGVWLRLTTYINPYLSQYYWTHAVSVESPHFLNLYLALLYCMCVRACMCVLVRVYVFVCVWGVHVCVFACCMLALWTLSHKNNQSGSNDCGARNLKC